MKTVIRWSLLAALVLIQAGCGSKEEPSPPSEPQEEAPTPLAEAGLHDFELADIDGNPVRLARFAGKVLLIVNVASKCGFTEQYAGLQSTYEKYKEQGFEILAFPANNFGRQEPGSNAEIKEFCKTTYGVTFPLFAKISVKGDDTHPLYQYLTDPDKTGEFAGEIKWNFNKFLVDRRGKVIGRYDSPVAPDGPELTAAIEGALKQ